MKQITGLKKLKNAVEVTFDDDQMVLVESELIIKYHISVGKSLDVDTYLMLIEENEYLSALRFAYAKLKKMMTSKEMKDALVAKGVSSLVQKRVMQILIDKKYIDDLAYTKTYVMLKKYQEGPHMMKHRLTEKGISETVLHMVFDNYHTKEIVEQLVESKLKSMKKKTKRQAFQTVKMQLIAKGFDADVIDLALMMQADAYQVDEKRLIETSYQKIMKSYSTKLSGHELQQKIKEKLYQKGFTYDTIKAYLEEIKLQSW